MAQSVRELASNQCRGQCLIQLTSRLLTITLESFCTFRGSHTYGIRVASNKGLTRFIKGKEIQKMSFYRYSNPETLEYKAVALAYRSQRSKPTLYCKSYGSCSVYQIQHKSASTVLSTEKKKKITKFIAVDETLIQSMYEYNLTYKCYNKKAE